jgi:hypothetical protein
MFGLVLRKMLPFLQLLCNDILMGVGIFSTEKDWPLLVGISNNAATLDAEKLTHKLSVEACRGEDLLMKWPTKLAPGSPEDRKHRL